MTAVVAWVLTHLRLVAYVAAALALAGLVAYGVHAFHERDLRLIESGRQEIRDADLAATRKVASEFASAVGDHERALLAQMEHRNAAFSKLAAESFHLPPLIRGLVVPGPVVGLLDRAVGEANGTTGPAGGADGTTPAAADIGRLSDWAVEVIRVCTLYRDRADAWARFYGNLQDITNGEAP